VAGLHHLTTHTSPTPQIPLQNQITCFLSLPFFQ